MKSLVKSIGLQWDLRKGPFRAFFPTQEQDRKRCAHLAKNDLFEEYIDVDNLHKKWIVRQMAACEDTRTGEIVACLFLEDALQMSNSSKKSAHYNLDLFSEEQLSKIAILSHLALNNIEEKATVAQVLFSHCFIEILKAGGQAMIISGDVGYFSIYKRLGLRPIGALTKSELGEMIIPMIFLPDYEYLLLIASPILDAIRGANFENYRSICDWYYELVKENSELKIGSAVYLENQAEVVGHKTITQGMSEIGVQTLLENAMLIKCREGEVLLEQDDRGSSFGYIKKGVVQILIGEKPVVLLGEGDVLGEMAYILNSKRTAKVVAASPETEIVLFNSNLINTLKNEQDKTAIWQNLARLVAQRLLLMNKMVG